MTLPSGRDSSAPTTRLGSAAITERLVPRPRGEQVRSRRATRGPRVRWLVPAGGALSARQESGKERSRQSVSVAESVMAKSSASLTISS